MLAIVLTTAIVTLLSGLLLAIPATIGSLAIYKQASRGWKSAAMGQTAAALAASAAATAADSAASAADTASQGIQDLQKRFQGNGKGDVVVMLESLVEWTETHDIRHKWMDANLKDLRDEVKPLTGGSGWGIGPKG